MAIETIRPTSLITVESWTAPTGNVYDGNTNTGTPRENVNADPSLIVGASGTEATNAWGTKANNWGSATVYIHIGKPAGSNDTVWAEYGEYSGGSYTKIGDLVAATSGAITKQNYSAALSTANFGTNFANIANLRVRVSGTKQAGPDNVTTTVYEVWVEGVYDDVVTVQNAAHSHTADNVTLSVAANTVLSNLAATSITDTSIIPKVDIDFP